MLEGRRIRKKLNYTVNKLNHPGASQTIEGGAMSDYYTPPHSTFLRQSRDTLTGPKVKVRHNPTNNHLVG